MDGGGGADGVDDRTFRVNFSSDGVGKLRELVKDKLREFMGDYTDDTLVEYVIVLLKNGRRKEEAKNELDVFLGNDSDSFISWLWDHLGSNLHLYVQPKDSGLNELSKIKPESVEQARRIDSHRLDSDLEGKKPDKLSRIHHKREWKGSVKDEDEPVPLRKSVVDNVHVDEGTHRKAKRSLSPGATDQRKRNKPDEIHIKREIASQAAVNAPRRLLQFAVRDAVATSLPSKPTKEPVSKHLRSVVSTSAGNATLVDRPQRVRPVRRVQSAMATAIKAVAEAARDVVKVRSSGNVFDRLGRDIDIEDTSNQLAEIRETTVEDEGYEDFGRIRAETSSTYLRRTDYSERYVGNITTLEGDTGMASDSASDNEGYGTVNAMGHGVMDACQRGTFTGKKGEDSLTMHYSLANKADESARKPWKDQDQQAASNPSNKIVNISVNLNTSKPHHYLQPKEISEMDVQKSVHENEAGMGLSIVEPMKENSNHIAVGNGNAKPALDVQGSQKALTSAPGSYTTGRPTEDADSRTIFVNNVHFGATKDSLSRHFNKFGEVLKVVIVTDAATGQPKGSAYVEFMRKEAAEHALSLDGTSFMSRILKVVRKSSANQEAAAGMTWPRIARGSPYSVPRFARVPFPRGIPNLYRPRLPIKPGARSLQWKRDSPSAPTDGSTAISNNSVPSPTTRSLTYVRTEPKSNGNSGAT